MRPIALEIEGLTAFRQKQPVDLTGLGLFVITGVTGSGKTSILDAITFALYGKVYRAGHGELKDLISHNSPDLKVQLDFDVQGTRYRIVRRTQRDGPTLATLWRMEGDEPILEVESGRVKPVDSRIKELLGLDYDAFTKAVLLPQGHFDAFLRGEDKERRRILSDLLELGCYEKMGEEARRTAREIASRLEERRRWLDGFADATPERLRETKRQVADATELASALSVAAIDLASMASTCRDTEHVAESIRNGLDPVRSVLDDLIPFRESLASLTPRDVSTAAALKDAESAVETAGKCQSGAETALKEALERLGDEGTLTGFRNAAGTIEDETERLAEADSRQAEERKRRKECARAVKEATAAYEVADGECTQSVEEGKRLRTEFELAEQVEKYVRALVEVRELDATLARAKDDSHAAGEEARDAEGTYEHLRNEHQATALRVGLEPGQACPVCEQTVSAVPPGRPELEKLLEVASSKLEDAHDTQRTTSEVATRVGAEVSTASKVVEEMAGILPAGFAAPDMETSVHDLEAARGALEKALGEHPAKEKARDAARDDLAGAKAAHDVAEERILACEKERVDLRGRIEQARAILRPRFGEEPAAVVLSTVDRWASELTACRTADTQARESREAARHSREVARDERDKVVKELQRLDTKLAQFRGAANQATRELTRRGASVADGVLAAGAGPATPAAQVDSLEQLCTAAIVAGESKIATTTEEAESLRTRMVEIAQSHDLAVEGLGAGDISEAADAAFRQAERDRDDATAAVSALEERIKTRQETVKSIKIDQDQQRLYDRLGRELQGNHFIAYVAQESMKTLSALATGELKKLTGDRYSLQPTEDGSGFEVVDHDNAGECRGIATLSGGETFLASLALALALSGSVRDLAGNAAAARLESMFIDEGFGALDEETLSTAVDALEGLAGDGRMIGVISHVPALGERIQAGLEVRKVGTSSTIARRDRPAPAPASMAPSA